MMCPPKSVFVKMMPNHQVWGKIFPDTPIFNATQRRQNLNLLKLRLHVTRVGSNDTKLKLGMFRPECKRATYNALCIPKINLLEWKCNGHVMVAIFRSVLV